MTISDPKQHCVTCDRSRSCMRHTRGFPPDGAKRWLLKTCPNDKKGCDIKYTAGLGFRSVMVGQ